MSTTVREPERILGFLQTAEEIEGSTWNTTTQEKFQILLIKNRQYLNDATNTQSFNKLTPTQAKWLKDKSFDMSYKQAKEIFDAKEYEDPPMRGRQSMSPLVKLGLVYIVNDTVAISDVGKKLISGQIEFGSFIFDSLLKFQYPNPTEKGFRHWNTKPFINTLRLIRSVNRLCNEKNIDEKGISTVEFGIFALSLKSYCDVEAVAEKVLDFRTQLELQPKPNREDYITSYIQSYLEEFNNGLGNPTMILRPDRGKEISVSSSALFVAAGFSTTTLFMSRLMQA